MSSRLHRAKDVVDEMAREKGGGLQTESPTDVTRLLGEEGYRRLKRVLRVQEGYDLDAYRGPYLARRLRARLAASRIQPEAYAAAVERDPNERHALMETLGVNVSTFMRDPEVWEFLEAEALPPLVEARAAEGRPLRAASLGCAGGQEPYTMAMILSEACRDAKVEWRVDGFDVDPAALSMAQEGAYPQEALENVSQRAIERYFVPIPGGRYQVAEPLRERVRILRRDVLTSPIPEQYDLIACRNVMIYIEPSAKERLLASAHRALRPDGLLVIGQSEVLMGAAAQRFVPLGTRCRVFRRGG